MPERTIPEVAHVEFGLTLDTIIDHNYRQVGEDDWEQEPISLGQAIVDQAARLLADQIRKQLDDSDYGHFQGIARNAAEAYAAQRIEKEMQREVTPTDQFGQPTGKPATLAALIDKKIDEWLVAPSGDYNRKSTKLDKLVEAAVDRRMQAEMRQSVKEAQVRVLRELTDSAETVLRDGLVEIVRAASAPR